MRGCATTVMAGIGKEAVTAVFLVALMFYQDWLLALIAFFAFPLAFRPLQKIGRRMRKVSANTQVELGQFMTLLDANLPGRALRQGLWHGGL